MRFLATTVNSNHWSSLICCWKNPGTQLFFGPFGSNNALREIIAQTSSLRRSNTGGGGSCIDLSEKICSTKSSISHTLMLLSTSSTMTASFFPDMFANTPASQESRDRNDLAHTSWHTWQYRLQSSDWQQILLCAGCEPYRMATPKV